MTKHLAKLFASRLVITGLMMLAFTPIKVSKAQGLPLDIWEGVYTVEQAKRGGSEYQTECASCHGEDLIGQDMSPSLVGIGFIFKWEGKNLQELYASMRYGMPQTAPGSLSNSAYADLTAFLLSRNGYPFGASELSVNENELAKIEISSRR
jgi:cytochrome c553